MHCKRNRKRRREQAKATLRPTSARQCCAVHPLLASACASRASIPLSENLERLVDLSKVKAKRWKSQGENTSTVWLQKSFIHTASL